MCVCAFVRALFSFFSFFSPLSFLGWAPSISCVCAYGGGGDGRLRSSRGCNTPEWIAETENEAQTRRREKKEERKKK